MTDVRSTEATYLEAAKERDRAIKNRTRRHRAAERRWLDLKTWKQSQTGGYYRKASGATFGIYHKSGEWKRYAKQGNERKFYDDTHATAVAAAKEWVAILLKHSPATIHIG